MSCTASMRRRFRREPVSKTLVRARTSIVIVPRLDAALPSDNGGLAAGDARCHFGRSRDPGEISDREPTGRRGMRMPSLECRWEKRDVDRREDARTIGGSHLETKCAAHLAIAPQSGGGRLEVRVELRERGDVARAGQTGGVERRCDRDLSD